MMFLVPFAVVSCLPLPPGAERVTAADLAPAFAGLASAPPQTVLSFAPEPGLQRVFHIPELRRIAAQFNLPAAPDAEICVSRTVAALEPAPLLAAMQKEMPGARIAILEFSRQPAPQGEITFRRTGLRSNSPDGAIWFGAVRYAPNRDFTIWAKVTLTAPVSRLVAKRDIAQGQRLEAEDVSIETREEFPASQAVLETAASVTGKCARAAIHAGSPIHPEMLEKAKDVRQGDLVEVEVEDGGAHLTLPAHAEASGSLGDVIFVRNPSSGKVFAAKVQGKDRVYVDATDSNAAHFKAAQAKEIQPKEAQSKANQ